MVSRFATRQRRGEVANEARPLRVLRGLPSGRAVVGGLLVAVAGVGTFAAYTSATADHRVDYVVARQPLTVGEQIAASDLSLAPMDLSPQIASRWAFRDSASLVGTIVVGPVAAGELVQASDVVAGAAAPQQEEMSFAVSSSDAVDGTLEPGDRVDVLATYGTGTQAQTVAVITNAPVVAQSAAGSGLAADGSADETLTLGLSSPAQSLALAHAVGTGQVMVVRVTGTGAGTGGTLGSGAGGTLGSGAGGTLGSGASLGLG